MKVDFMIIGAQKCGTTTLFDILSTHPSTTPCQTKEPHFFSNSKNWRSELSAYEKLYGPPKEKTLFFEGSTTYTFLPLKKLCIWNDIYEYNPKMKFLYLVRNPIERIISGYMHSYERGYTDRTIEDELIARRHLIDITRYYTQINPFIEKFGRDRLLILDFDDLIQNREAVLENISNFLNISLLGFSGFEAAHSNISIGGSKKHHAFSSPTLKQRLISSFFPKYWERIMENEKSRRSFQERPTLSTVFKEVIIHMLDSEIDKTQELLGKNLSHWKNIEA